MKALHQNTHLFKMSNFVGWDFKLQNLQTGGNLGNYND